MFLVFLHVSPHLQPLEHPRDIRMQVHRRLIQLLPLEHPQNAYCKHDADTSSWFISFGLRTPLPFNHPFPNGLDRDGRGSFAFFHIMHWKFVCRIWRCKASFAGGKGNQGSSYLVKCCCSLFGDIYSVYPMVVQLADKCFSISQDAFLWWTMFA